MGLDRNHNDIRHLLDSVVILVIVFAQIPFLVVSTVLESNKVVLVSGIKEGLLFLVVHGIAKVMDDMGGLGIVGVLLGQHRRQEEGTKPKGNDGVSSTTHEINDVMVSKVHSGPPDPENIGHSKRNGAGSKDVDEEEGQLPGTGRVQRGESTKDQGRSRERGLVHVGSQDVIHTGESTWITRHGVSGRLQSSIARFIPYLAQKIIVSLDILFFPFRGTRRYVAHRHALYHVAILDRQLTWWRAREKQLSQDTSNVHVSKGPGKDWESARGSKVRNQDGSEHREHKVQNTVGHPGQQVLQRISCGGELFRNVASVKNVFECRQDRGKDMRSP